MTKEQAQEILQTTTESYNQVAQDFASTRVFAWPEAKLFEPFLEKLAKPIVVADIGCANGRMVAWVEKIGGTYVGIEPAEKLLTIAQNQFPQHRFLSGDLLNLPLESASVDVVLLNATLHHVPKPLLAQALEELRSVLKPGGLVLIVNWNLWQPRFVRAHLAEWVRQLTQRSLLGWQDIWVEYSSPDKKTRVNRFYHGFTLHELDHLAKTHGFSVESQYYTYKTVRTHSLHGRNILSVWKKN